MTAHVNSSPSKIGSKISASINKKRSNSSVQNESAERSGQNTVSNTERNENVANIAASNGENVENVTGAIDSNNNRDNDGNNNNFFFNPTMSQTERQVFYFTSNF